MLKTKRFSIYAWVVLVVTALVAGSFAFAAPQKALAASECSETDYVCIFEITNLAGDGIITPETPSPKPLVGQLEVTLQVDIPEAVESGDKMFLAISSPFVVSNFQPKKLLSSDGSVEYATITRNAVGLEVLFEEGATLHNNAKASITFTVYPAPTEFTDEVYPLTFYAGATQAEAVAQNVNIGPNQDILVKARAKVNNGFSGGAIYPNNELGVMASSIFVLPENFDPAKLTIKLTPNPIENGFPRPITDLTAYSYLLRRDENAANLSQTYDVVSSISGDTVTLKLPADFNATGVSSVVMTYGFYVDKAKTPYTFDAVMIYDGKTIIDSPLSITSGNLAGGGEGTLAPAVINTEKNITSHDESAGIVTVGDNITYELKTTNLEKLRNAYNVVTTDTLPEGVTFVAASDGGVYANGVVTWPARTIAAGEVVTYEVVVSVDEYIEGILRNVVTNVGDNVCLPSDTTSVCTDEALAEVVELKPELREAIPVAPTVVPAKECDAYPTIDFPEVDGITYRYVSNSDPETGIQIVTVYADAEEGWFIPDGVDTVWNFSLEITESCPVPPIEVTPVVPQVVVSEQCDVNSTVEVAETEGVEYSVSEDGNFVTVVATALDGYIFAPGTVSEWTFDVSPVETCEVPQSPDVEKPQSPEPQSPEVTKPPTSGGLAQTGAAGSWLLGIGAVLLIIGGVLVAARSGKSPKQ